MDDLPVNACEFHSIQSFLKLFHHSILAVAKIVIYYLDIVI